MPAASSMLGLMGRRRFLPYFLTQFFGAFNDNVLRQALILFITTSAVSRFSPNLLNNIALALFILPFFLFSGLAGQFADKFDKAKLVFWVKVSELVLMLLAAVGFYYQSLWGLMAVLFAMGFQSTCFGPIKYSIMPQHLGSQELVAGNALVQQGTYVAILLGSVMGVLLNASFAAPWWGSAALVFIAVSGLVSGYFVPSAPSQVPELKINWNPFTETIKVMRYAKQKRAVWIAVLSVSWFWFLGAAYTTQLKVYVDDYLHAGETVYALLLMVFSFGIGIGSWACKAVSRGRLTLSLVPLGALAITVFGVDLYFAYQGLLAVESATVAEFMAQKGVWRLLFDLLLIGVGGGFYVVPLFTYIQEATAETHRARVIAACNVLNALFMVLSALFSMVLLSALGITLPTYFLILALLSLVVSMYLLSRVPEFKIRRW
mgnify:CR=1 FL=1